MRFIFKKVLSDHDTSKIMTYIEDSKNKEITLALEKNIGHLATKEDLAKLEIKISDTNLISVHGCLCFGRDRLG